MQVFPPTAVLVPTLAGLTGFAQAGAATAAAKDPAISIAPAEAEARLQTCLQALGAPLKMGSAKTLLDGTAR